MNSNRISKGYVKATKAYVISGKHVFLHCFEVEGNIEANCLVNNTDIDYVSYCY